jgi:hypothetical protein
MLRKIDAMHQRFGKLDGKQCRDCSNFVVHWMSRNFQKCSVYGDTCSEASDWRQKWTACGQFGKEYTGRCVMETLSRRKEPEPPVEMDGQTSMYDV